jgi:hypothetical protein
MPTQYKCEAQSPLQEMGINKVMSSEYANAPQKFRPIKQPNANQANFSDNIAMYTLNNTTKSTFITNKRFVSTSCTLCNFYTHKKIQ